MIVFDEKLTHLIQPAGESILGPEKVLWMENTGLAHFQVIEDHSLRMVYWKGTLIVSGLRYFVNNGIILIHEIYTRPGDRRSGYARKLYQQLANDKIMVPDIYTESGKLFFKSMGLS